MEARPEDVFRSLRGLASGAYPALVTAAACALLVLLLWPNSRRTYLAESLAVASEGAQSPTMTADAVQWLQSEAVLQAAVANLRREQPRALAAVQAESPGGDTIGAIRGRLQTARVSGPDELPRLAISAEAASRRSALALAEELARQLRDHYAVQRAQDRLTDFRTRERIARDELNEARAARQRMEIQLEGLRHAQLTSAVAATDEREPSPPSAASIEPASHLQKTLDAMKLERVRLLEVYLPAHPQVQTLSAQISRLEETLRESSGRNADGWEETSAEETQTGGSRILLEWRRNRHSDLALTGGQESMPSQDRAGQLAEAIRQAQIDLLSATQRAQAAEQAWQQLEQERGEHERRGGVHWAIEPAKIVGQSGAAESRTQLAVALFAAMIGAGGAVGLARMAAKDRLLGTIADLRASVELPVLGSLASEDNETAAPRTRGSLRALRFITRGSEAVLLTFVVTLLAAAALDRGVLTDLACDPLATLGELVQRLI